MNQYLVHTLAHLLWYALINLPELVDLPSIVSTVNPFVCYSKVIAL